VGEGVGWGWKVFFWGGSKNSVVEIHRSGL
jgi:hypothetical protein